MRILKDLSGKLSVVETSLGLRLESVAIFLVSIAAMALMVTFIYWGLFGFGHWKNEMTVAGKIMVAAATAPVASAPPAAGQAGQYVCSVHGAVGLPRFNAAGVPLCPVCGKAMQFRCSPAASATPAAWAGG